jgi:hypothetical protein
MRKICEGSTFAVKLKKYRTQMEPLANVPTMTGHWRQYLAEMGQPCRLAEVFGLCAEIHYGARVDCGVVVHEAALYGYAYGLSASA